jgi:arylsulfatase A-like enzyme
VPELDTAGRATGARIPAAPPGTLADNLAWFDASMGRLIGSLERLGIADRTIIMVTADNGTAGYGKGKLTSEIALRVPFIVWGPGYVPARGPVDALIEMTDVLPTLLDLAGRPPTKEALLDGVSFAPLLRGEAFAGRDMIFSYSGTARWLRDARWLLDGTGRLWDCGDSRDETRGYRDASREQTPQARAARARFEQRLLDLPGPDPEDPEIGKAVTRWMKAHPEASR